MDSRRLDQLGASDSGLQSLTRVRRNARPMPVARIISLRERLRTAFGRQPPEILMSGEATAPVAWGYRRPTVLLPSAFLTRFNDDQLFQMLVHECAHAVRRDTLVGLYQRFWPAYFGFIPDVCCQPPAGPCARTCAITSLLLLWFDRYLT